MNTQTAAERCQGLLAEMGRIPVIIPGKLCQRRGEKGKITGWKLQRWQKGHNETRYIPAGLTERIQEGTAGCQRFMALAHEYTEVKGEEALADLSAPRHAKKKSP